MGLLRDGLGFSVVMGDTDLTQSRLDKYSPAHALEGAQSYTKHLQYIFSCLQGLVLKESAGGILESQSQRLSYLTLNVP